MFLLVVIKNDNDKKDKKFRLAHLVSLELHDSDIITKSPVAIISDKGRDNDESLSSEKTANVVGFSLASFFEHSPCSTSSTSSVFLTDELLNVDERISTGIFQCLPFSATPPFAVRSHKKRLAYLQFYTLIIWMFTIQFKLINLRF